MSFIKSVFVLFATCFLIFNSFGQKIQEEKVKSVIIEFFDGLSELNDQKISSTVTSDFILLENGEVWNLDTLLHRIAPARNQKFKRDNFFEFIDIKVRGNEAWVSYWNKAVYIINERSRTARWLESAVLQKVNGNWKINLLHSTVLRNE